MLDLLTKIAKSGQKYGEILVSLSSAKETSVTYEQNEFNSSSTGYSDLLKIKAVKGRKFGFAVTTDVSKWEDCLKTAVKMMKISPELPSEIQLSVPTKNKKIEHFDKRIDQLNCEKMDAYAVSALNLALDKKLDVPNVGVTSATETLSFANSNQQSYSYSKSLLSFFMECVHGESSGSEGHVFTKIFDTQKYAKDAIEMCIESENMRPIKTMKADLVLDYFGFSNLVSNILMPSFYADRIQNKRSFLTGKLGKKIFSKNLTITDNGMLNDGLFSMPFDAEGTPTQKTVLVENGTVKNFLYDNYSALINKTKSTGNCMDIGRTPCIGATNFCIKPGDLTKEEMLESVKLGVFSKYIMGGHTVNEITGDISVGLSNAWLVEKGKIGCPVKQAMVSFNFFDALKQVSEISRKIRQESNVAAPLVKFKDIQFIS